MSGRLQSLLCVSLLDEPDSFTETKQGNKKRPAADAPLSEPAPKRAKLEVHLYSHSLQNRVTTVLWFDCPAFAQVQDPPASPPRHDPDSLPVQSDRDCQHCGTKGTAVRFRDIDCDLCAACLFAEARVPHMTCSICTHIVFTALDEYWEVRPLHREDGRCIICDPCCRNLERAASAKAGEDA